MNDRLPYGEWVGSIRTPIPGPESTLLAQRLKNVEAPGITYLSNDFPVFWKRAGGSNVTDVDGNIFVDLSSAFGVTNLGHANRKVTEKIATQLKNLPHGMGDVHPPEIKVELLERLAGLYPAPGAQSILCSSGAEAVEAALKTAFLATGRPGVLYFEGSYHGLTYGTLPVTGHLKFKEPFLPQIAQFGVKARFPREQGDGNPQAIENSIAEIRNLIEKSEDEKKPVGAILLEPIQGRGGIIVPPKGWLKAVRNLTTQYGILLIADEIMTGFGRTGWRFAMESEQVVPHLMCLGKALTGMLPFSACIGSGEVMRSWPTSTGEALHTSTFLGNPLGCAAALAALQEYDRRDLSLRAQRLGRNFLTQLRSWMKEISIIKEVRGRGFMLGIELAKNDEHGLAFEVAKKALGKGVIVLPAGLNGNVVSIVPPLTIGGRQIDWAFETLRIVLQSLS